MERTEFYVISFENTHSAMEAQKILRPRYSITVIPTLREVSQSCGISVMLPPMDQQEAITAANSLGMEKGMFQLYFAKGDKNHRQVEAIQTYKSPWEARLPKDFFRLFSSIPCQGAIFDL